MSAELLPIGLQLVDEYAGAAVMAFAGVLLAAALEEALEEELPELHPLRARAAAAPVAALPARKPRRVNFGCCIVPSNLWSAGRLSRRERSCRRLRYAWYSLSLKSRLK